MFGRIIPLSGSCGSGKTTTARLLAERSSCGRTVHLHTGDFYQYICSGYIPPWMEESGEQNDTVIQAAAAAAGAFCKGGYEVYVDGVIGPWFLTPWLRLAEAGMDIRYLILRPSEEETAARASAREQKEEFPLNLEMVRKLWRSFSRLGPYERNTVDTTGQTAEESAAQILRALQDGRFRIR